MAVLKIHSNLKVLITVNTEINKIKINHCSNVIVDPRIYTLNYTCQIEIACFVVIRSVWYVQTVTAYNAQVLRMYKPLPLGCIEKNYFTKNKERNF